MKSSSRKRSRKAKTSTTVHHSRRKNKSKKRHHRDVSVSDSDSDWRSGSSLSISSSSSDDGYRGRRTTRAREIAKRNLKRSRRSSSSSSESRRPIHRHHKRKSDSKRSTKLDKRKKPIKKKHVNACSPSSHSSRSCSTCGDFSSSDIEGSEIERSKRSVGRKANIRGRSHRRDNSGKRRYHSCSRSSSSCGGCTRGSHGRSNERFVEERFPRRLGSVITVFRDSESSRGKDDDKAEIIAAHDDCPSRSNDSYEGIGKRDSEHQHFDHSSQWALEKVRAVNEEIKNVDDDAGTQTGQGDPSLPEKNNDVSVDVEGSETQDLEYLLRQKALENFKRFRNGLATSKSYSDEKGGNGVLKQSTVESAQTQYLKIRKASLDDEFAVDLGNHGCTPGRHESESKTVVNPPSDGGIADNPAENNNLIGLNSKTQKGASTFRSDSIGNKSIHHQMCSGKSEQAGNVSITAVTSHLNENQCGRKEEVELCEHSKKHPGQSSRSKDALLEKVTGVPRATAAQSIEDVDVKKSDASGSVPSSHHKPVLKDHASTETMAEEAKDGSQYEQKTMSVMRGGEMVQVSYKVYIPKKPPALARRQLRR